MESKLSLFQCKMSLLIDSWYQLKTYIEILISKWLYNNNDLYNMYVDYGYRSYLIIELFRNKSIKKNL